MERLVSGVIVLLTCVTYCVHGDDTGCMTSMPHTTLVTRRHDTCYQFVSDENSWRGARAYCYRYGGRLVNIDDSGTNEFILNALDNLDQWTNNGVWIGLHDRGDELNWRWDAGDRAEDTRMTWSYWARGHPSAFLHSMRDCVRMVRKSNWKWHETPCNLFKWKYRFICQYEAEETTTVPPMDGWNNQWLGGRPIDDDHRYKLSSVDKSGDTTPPQVTEEEDIWHHMRAELTGIPPLSAQQVGQESTNKAATAGWIVAIAVAFIILVVAIILVVIIRRRRQKKEPYIDNYSNQRMVEKPIYKKEKASSGWLHEGKVRSPNDYVLDWSCPSPQSPEHLYEECPARGAQRTSAIYANDDRKGKVSARSENDNLENDDTEKHKLLKKSTEEESKTPSLYLPMNGSVSSLESGSSCSMKPQPRSPASDDGYQMPKPRTPSEYHIPQPLGSAGMDGYQVPRSVARMEYDVPKPVDDGHSDSETDAELQHIYESIDEINAQRK